MYLSCLLLFLCLSSFCRPAHSADCSAHTSCGTCTQVTGCGWCGYFQSCLAGNKSSDYGETCQQLGWLYGPTSCPAPCPTFQNCSTCLDQNYNCGWCPATQSCLPVNYDNGKRDNPQCNFTWAPFLNLYAASCPMCNTRSNCSACSAAAKENPQQYTCGWCGELEACVEGNSSTPYVKHCKQWIYAASCPDCERHKSCYDCSFASNMDCGWCEDSQQCLSGSETSHPPCTTWIFGKTGSCRHPYPWLPQSTNQNSNPMPLSGVEITAVIIGALFVLAIPSILIYIGARKYLRHRRQSNYFYSRVATG